MVNHQTNMESHNWKHNYESIDLPLRFVPSFSWESRCRTQCYPRICGCHAFSADIRHAEWVTTRFCTLCSPMSSIRPTDAALFPNWNNWQINTMKYNETQRKFPFTTKVFGDYTSFTYYWICPDAEHFEFVEIDWWDLWCQDQTVCQPATIESDSVIHKS